MSDESELIAQSRAGDRRAFDALMRRYSERLFRLTHKVCAQAPSEADDVYQETFLTAFRKMAGFREQSALGSWLFRIASNLCWMRLRRRKREAFVPILDLPEERGERPARSLAAPGDDPALDAHKNDLRRSVARALERLPAGDREIVFLSDVGEWKNRDIARRTGLSLAAVKSRLHRARRALKEHLKDRDGVSPS